MNKTNAALTELAGMTLAKADALKGPTSDKDIAFLKDVVAGRLEVNAEVMRHIAGLAITANHNSLFQADNQYNSALTVDGAGEAGKLYPKPKFSYKVPENKEFQVDDNNQMRYNSPLYEQKAKGAAGGKRMSAAEFLKGN